MMTYNEAIQSVRAKNKEHAKELRESMNRQYGGIINEIMTNPNTRELLMTQLTKMIQVHGELDLYDVTLCAYVEGLLIGLKMNSPHIEGEEKRK